MIVIVIAALASIAAILARIAREEAERVAREEALLLEIEAYERAECPEGCGVCRICEAEEEEGRREAMEEMVREREAWEASMWEAERQERIERMKNPIRWGIALCACGHAPWGECPDADCQEF